MPRRPGSRRPWRSLVTNLLMMGGALLLVAGFVIVPEDVRELESSAAASVKVRAEVISTRISAARKRRHYPFGDVRVEGRDFDVSLDRDAGFLDRPRRDEASARARAALFPPGTVVDAWYDPRPSEEPRFTAVHLVRSVRAGGIQIPGVSSR